MEIKQRYYFLFSQAQSFHENDKLMTVLLLGLTSRPISQLPAPDCAGPYAPTNCSPHFCTIVIASPDATTACGIGTPNAEHTASTADDSAGEAAGADAIVVDLAAALEESVAVCVVLAEWV